MTETTHTIVVLDDGETYSGADGATLQVITDAQHEDLCEGAEPDDLEPVAAYDIAALPDLLEALKEVYKWGQRSEHERQQNGPMLKDYLRQAAETARAAIAKATGGDPC